MRKEFETFLTASGWRREDGTPATFTRQVTQQSQFILNNNVQNVSHTVEYTLRDAGEATLYDALDNVQLTYDEIEICVSGRPSIVEFVSNVDQLRNIANIVDFQ